MQFLQKNLFTLAYKVKLYNHSFAGEKEDVINVEEQFLNGIYTPEFLQQQDPENDPSLANKKRSNSKFH